MISIPIPNLTEMQRIRFYSKYEKGDDKTCWIWNAGKQRGYGIMKVGKLLLKASRIAWFLYFGHDPGDLFVCHHCDNPPCVNPHHLFLGTNKDNKHDCMKKGRHAIGQSNPRSKLTALNVSEIRKLWQSGNSHSELSKNFGVSASNISLIVNKHTWKEGAT